MSSKHKQKGCMNFISDGAVNPEIYEHTSPKIVFFLKEAYSKDENDSWSLTDWLNNGAMTKMWGTVAEWTYGLLNTTSLVIPSRPHLSKAERTDLLKSIAIVNVKKSNGKKESNYSNLLTYAEDDQFYLRKQLEILNPDIIVCGNNSSLLRILYGAEIKEGKVLSDGLVDAAFMLENGYAYIDNQIVIDYYHPANQFPAMLNYYAICSLYQQALKRKEL